MKTKNSTGKAAGKGSKKFAEGINWINDAFAVDKINNYSDEVCFFDLYIKSELGPICIYGCKIISSEGKDPFISFPSSKGSNGKYFNHCYMDISDDIRDAIIEAIESQLS